MKKCGGGTRGQNDIEGWEFRLVVEPLPSMWKVLGLVPSPENTNKKQKGHSSTPTQGHSESKIRIMCPPTEEIYLQVYSQ